MYPDGSYGRYMPYEQSVDDNVDDYIRSASYENDRSNYGIQNPRPRAIRDLTLINQAHPHRSTAMSRQSQAAVGRARLSLPPSAPVPLEIDDFQTYDYVPSIHEEYPRRYMDVQETRSLIQPTSLLVPPDQPYHRQIFQQQGSSSSPVNALPSSPAYRASQRQQNPEPVMPARSYPEVQQRRPGTTEGPPIVQGIQLVPVHTLPDRFQTVFPFAMFNAVQSACFESIYESHDNCVFSSPTGSGKTVLFEIAICRMLRGWQSGTFKIIYMAPTKSLCSERARDWKTKFEPLNLKCEEMTGDSDITSLHHVQRADIIVTTPEKWDSMTRKWKDHSNLVRLIKLLLIDEVHILNKDRGAALEVVVSRMKSIGSGARFIALSATVPNSQDIATWLGRNGDLPDIPATHKRFGEEFRPVQLERHICGYQSTANAFGFDAILTKK
jgi:ATP-dependent DNA helicase HFM1/MER3